MEFFTYYHTAVQTEEVSDLKGSVMNDTLPIRFQYIKYRQTNPNTVDTYVLVAKVDTVMKFSSFKKQLSDNYDSSRKYEAFLTKYLSIMGVPNDEHLACVHAVFRAMETVVNPEIPLLVSVYDATIIDGDESVVRARLNWVPASRSFIQGLVEVTLDRDVMAASPNCAVCLEDFDMDQQQEAHVTQLPCAHYFHLDCIVQCLAMNHMCPLCRYEMPMEED